MAERGGSDMRKPRPFEAKQLRTRFRGWQLIATRKTVTSVKGTQSFEITRKLTGFEAALRAGKREVDRREGVEIWNANYTNEALQGEQK